MLCRPGLILLAHKALATQQLANYRKASTRFFDAQLVHVLFNYPTIISEALQSRTGLDQYQCKLLSLKATFTWSQSFPSGYSETRLSASAKLMFINRGVRNCFLNSCRMKQDLWFRPSVDAIDSLSINILECIKWHNFSSKRKSAFCHESYCWQWNVLSLNTSFSDMDNVGSTDNLAQIRSEVIHFHPYLPQFTLHIFKPRLLLR